MVRSSLLTLAGVFSLCAISAHAAPQPVAFLGDTLAQQWSQQPDFQKHPNWTYYSLPDIGVTGLGTPEMAELATLKVLIRNGGNPVIVIMTGEWDSETVSPGNQHSSIFAIWAQGWENIVTTAQQAGLTVILSTIPYSVIGDVHDMNKYILAYGAAHKLPVVNFDYALNTIAPPTVSPVAYYLDGQPSPTDGYSQQIYTTQGYDLLTDMAEVAIGTTTGAIQFQSGYLDTWINDNNEDSQPLQTQNTNIDGGTTQFIAYATYTDGSTHRVQNADIDGHIGTWSSSNPLVMPIDWSGKGMGAASGSTDVHFMDPQGKIFNAWTMYNVVYVFGCPNNPCVTY